MSNLLVWKEKLQRLYAKYSFYIDKACLLYTSLIWGRKAEIKAAL